MYIYISQLVLAVVVFEETYSHLKVTISGYRRFYLTSYIWRYVIMEIRRFLPNCSRCELNELKMQLFDFILNLVLSLVPWEQVFCV